MTNSPSYRLKHALKLDEFSDREKYYGGAYYPQKVVNFLTKHRGEGERWLDIGCGTGGAFSLLPVTNAVEPNFKRRMKASEHEKVDVQEAWAEEVGELYGPYEFGTVTYLRGFFQCRSDYETLIAVNTVLVDDGIFMFDVPTERDPPPICGRSFVLGTLKSVTMRHFGFEHVATGPSWEGLTLLAFRKVNVFSHCTYNRPQIVPTAHTTDTKTRRRVRINNFSSWEYWATPAMKKRFKQLDHAKRGEGTWAGEIPWEFK